MNRLLPIGLALLVLAGGFLVYNSAAQPVRREVLRELRIQDVGGCQEITTELQFPIVLEGYAPMVRSPMLLVRLIPVEIGNISADAVAGREALVPDRETETVLQQVTWEGDAPEGPQLVFHFDRAVAYDVVVGKDFRSVVVTLHPETRDPAPCNGRGQVMQQEAR